MPFQQQLSPVSMAIDCLNNMKYLLLRDAFGIMETATPQLKQTINRMNQDHLSMADDWFRLMNNRGWYQVPQARPDIVSQLMSQVQTITSQVRIAPAQYGQQQFQQTTGYYRTT
jgi:spore coat protein CotF